jgi:hypothetical protein
MILRYLKLTLNIKVPKLVKKIYVCTVAILHLFSRKKPGLHSKNYKSASRIAGEKWREYLKMPNINLN